MKQYIQPATDVATEIKNSILAGSLNINDGTTTNQLAPEENTADDIWYFEW